MEPSNLKIGYVGSESVLFLGATVYETFLHFASLVHANCSTQVIEDKAQSLIDSLSLQACAGSKLDVLSCGEKKRVEIEVEVLKEHVLLLDKALSSLDAYNALKVMQLVRRFANDGMAVVISLHQPRRGVFELSDNLLYIAEGELLFFGPKEEVRAAISSHDRVPPDTAIDEEDSKYILDVVGSLRSRSEASTNFHEWSEHFRMNFPKAFDHFLIGEEMKEFEPRWQDGEKNSGEYSRSGAELGQFEF